MTVRELDPAEFAEVETANAMLRRFTTGSPYQRLHQSVRLLGQHAERARTSAVRVPQPPLQRETARIDRAVSATLTASEALLGSLVNDIVTGHGQQSPQAVTMREAVDQARDSSPVVALSRPLLALAATQPSLVEMRDLSGCGPFVGEDGGEGSQPVWEPVLRESVATTLVAAVGPTAAPLTTAPVRIVPLLQELVIAARLGWAVFLLLVALGALLDTLDVTQVPPGVVLPAALTGIAVRLLVGWKSGGGQPLIALGFVLLCATLLTILVEPGSGNQASITLGDGQQATGRGSIAVTGDTIEIVAGDSYFEPTVLTGPAGQQLQLTVRNQGEALHNLAIDGQGIDQDIKAGATATVQVRFPTSGAVTFVCKYHLPQNMRGELQAT